MTEEGSYDGKLERFAYGSRTLGSTEIRILQLLPYRFRVDGTDIHCSLVRLDLSAAEDFGIKEQPFIALSYVWGACEPEKKIFIDGKTKTVTPNLYDALLQIREKFAPVPLWIDAICINQDNMAERALQVARMADIYSQASTVIFWLGRYDEKNDVVGDLSPVPNHNPLGTLQRLGDVDMFGKYLRKRGNETNPWLFRRGLIESKGDGGAVLEGVLSTLYSLPFWRRVWIMQELVLAKNAFLLWGSQVIDFGVLEAQYDVRSVFVPTRAERKERHGEKLRLYGMVQQAIAMRLRRPRLLEALLAVRYRLATEPRDYIYGVLSIARTGPHKITADYTKTPRDVYLDAFQVILQQEPNLDILSACDRGWADVEQSTSTEPSWPSWLPDWSHESFKIITPHDELQRTCAPVHSILLDYQENAPVDFRAGGETKSAKILSTDPDILSVRGIHFDTVKDVIYQIDAKELSGIKATWTHTVLKLWDDGYLKNVYPDLVRLRHACVDIINYGRPWVYFFLCNCNRRLFPEEWLSTQRSPSHDPGSLPVLPSKLLINGSKQGHFDQTQSFSVQDSQSWIIYTERGFIGRSPNQPKVGDVVAVFLGGKVPFLLRPQPNSDYYKLAGEIYIPSIMEGEAVNAMKDECKEFFIV